ncbi:DUF3891 family protein [Planctomycetota bacterium]|nr:DUF3891 family protein [Planctomycetota bacterium]
MNKNHKADLQSNHMIILPQPDNKLRIVFQPDHARHTALLVRNWVKPNQIPDNLWERLIAATEHHDDGWHMHKYQPLINEQGEPYSFLNLPIETHLKYLHYCTDSIMKKDLYQALLITLHFRWIFSKSPKSNISDQKLVDEYLSWSDSMIDRSIERLRDEEPPENHQALTRPILRLAQRILSFNDRVSLMLIGALPWARFDEPVNYSINEVVMRYKHDEWGVRLDPWPYKPPFFSININARNLDHDHFETSEELFDQLGNAPTYRIVHRIMPY